MVSRPGWRARVEALMDAVADVAPSDHPQRGGSGSAAHHTLFGRYAGALRDAKEHAEGWWQALIDTEEEDRTGDAEQAEINVKTRRPVGPVAHGVVIAAVREFWLRCAALNRRVEGTQQVAPEEFILGWLLSADHEDLAEFLAGLPFWPVGLEGRGTWV